MKFLFFGISVILFLLTLTVIFKVNELSNFEYQKPQILSDKKILTVYYSTGGNTKTVAQNLHSIIDGDIKEIQLQEKYPNNIFKMSKLIRKQMKEDYLPEIVNIDISNYDVIFIGSPIWNFSMSLPIKSFLKSNNFENKILIPFFTYSGGANKDRVFNNIKNLTNAKDIKKPLFLFENGIFLTKKQLIKWLNQL